MAYLYGDRIMTNLDIEIMENIFSGIVSYCRDVYSIYRERFCLECCRLLDDRKSLRQHDTEKHSKCTDCKMLFASLASARSHRTYYHGGY